MARQSPKERTARREYGRAKHESSPGEGGRFHALEKVAAAGGARDPGAVAASIGRKKYGAKRFAEMAAKGRKRG